MFFQRQPVRCRPVLLAGLCGGSCPCSCPCSCPGPDSQSQAGIEGWCGSTQPPSEHQFSVPLRGRGRGVGASRPIEPFKSHRRSDPAACQSITLTENWKITTKVQTWAANYCIIVWAIVVLHLPSEFLCFSRVTDCCTTSEILSTHPITTYYSINYFLNFLDTVVQFLANARKCDRKEAGVGQYNWDS